LVNSSITVEQGHQAASEVKNRRLSGVKHVQDVIVHISPYQPRQISGGNHVG